MREGEKTYKETEGGDICLKRDKKKDTGKHRKGQGERADDRE